MKTTDILLELILNEVFKHKNLKIGDVELDISVADLYILADRKKTKRSINLALKKLADVGMLQYNPEEKKKTKNLILKNVICFSKKIKDDVFFDFDNTFYDYFSNFDETNILDSIKCQNNKNTILKKYINFIYEISLEFSNKRRCFKNAGLFSDFIVIDFPTKVNIQTAKDFANSTKCFTKSFADLHIRSENFISFKLRKILPIQPKVSQICERFAKICENWKTMYVHKNILLSENRNNVQIPCTYIVSEISQIDSKVSQIKRKQKMEKENFIGKFKPNYKKNSKDSKVLFVSKSQSINIEDILDDKEVVRGIENMPLSAYKARQWMDLIYKLHKKIRGYNYNSGILVDSQALTGKIYPLVFEKFEFSAIDFKEYIEELIEQKDYSGKFVKFIVGFIGSNDSRINDIERFIGHKKRLREEDIFEDKIYLPHWPLTADNDDLYTVINRMPKRPLAILYNYGIVLYYRFLQAKNAFSMEEAIDEISRIFIKEFIELKMIDSHPDVVEKILAGIAKNTLLWEPYPENEAGKSTYLKHIDWRKSFYKIFSDKKFKITSSLWWKDHQNNNLNKIPAVDLMFKKRNKNALHIENLVV